jgi:uncharacterized cofD-like protein
VPDIAAAIQASRALKIYICNVATQQGETEGYTAENHITALNDHIGATIFDIVVINNSYEGQLPNGSEWVKSMPETESEYPVYRSDLVDHIQPWRHDSSKLARVIIDLYQERTGPLVES